MQVVWRPGLVERARGALPVAIAREHQPPAIGGAAYLFGPVFPHGHGSQAFVQKHQQVIAGAVGVDPLAFNRNVQARMLDGNKNGSVGCFCHGASKPGHHNPDDYIRVKLLRLPVTERLLGLAMKFNEFKVGMVIKHDPIVVSEEEMLAFAKSYDPQWFHVDPEQSKEGRWGGLIGSGWLTCGLAMRMAVNAALNGSESF